MKRRMPSKAVEMGPKVRRLSARIPWRKIPIWKRSTELRPKTLRKTTLRFHQSRTWKCKRKRRPSQRGVRAYRRRAKELPTQT